MNGSNHRSFVALSVMVQGLLTALAPQVTIKMIKRMVGKNFENAEELEAKPEYIRQLRALGIGLMVAGATGFVLERTSEETRENEHENQSKDGHEDEYDSESEDESQNEHEHQSEDGNIDRV